MDKKNKNLIIIGSVIAVVAIIVVVVLVLVLNKKPHEMKRKDSNESEILPTLIGLEDYTYSCDKELENEENLDYVTILYERLKVEDGVVLSAQSTIKRFYYSQESYEKGKKENLGDNVLYLGNELSIEYPDGELIDYTKTEDGQEVKLLYSEFKTTHEALGYACTRIEEGDVRK